MIYIIVILALIVFLLLLCCSILFFRMKDMSKAEKSREEMMRLGRLEFESLSQQILSHNSSRLKAENSEQISQMLNPLKTRIEEFSKAVTDSYIKENAQRQSLTDRIERLSLLNQTLSEDAKNLTDALRGNSKIQGDWGETILQTLLEQAGLKKDINFTLQVSRDDAGAALRDEDGKLRRPDVVVHLPEDRNIIIDSKVSLRSYADYISADSEEQRRESAKRLIQSVKRHIDELHAKRYDKLIKNSAEHVLMFIPNEGAYFVAMDKDLELWRYAFERKIVIVSPTHLFSVMQLVEQLWRSEKQNRNAAEIAALGGHIYDKIATFTQEFESIQKGIRSTETAWENCMRHLTSGNTSVIARTNRLKELGAKTSKHLPKNISQTGEGNEV